MAPPEAMLVNHPDDGSFGRKSGGPKSFKRLCSIFPERFREDLK